MAYRGDTTDPLQNILNRQRATRTFVVLLIAVRIVPYMQLNWSAFTRVFPEPAAQGAPTSNAVPIGRVPSTSAVPPTKMSATALEQLLRSAPASKRPPQNLRCLPIQGGWDYFCAYETDVPQPHTQLKIGVRVSAYGIVQASEPQRLDTPLVSPQPKAR